MDTTTIAHELSALEERYRCELMDAEERLELRERILGLRKKAETTKAGRS